MAFPKGSRWFIDDFGASGKDIDGNIIDTVYSLHTTTREEVKALENDYSKDVGVYDPNRGEKPEYSVFVKYPKGTKEGENSGYLSINPNQLDETLEQAKKFNVDVELFHGTLLLKDDKTADATKNYYDKESAAARLKARQAFAQRQFDEMKTFLPFTDEGGRKRSSRTRTIRKTRKRSVRRHRRTNNRRHRRNVKK